MASIDLDAHNMLGAVMLADIKYVLITAAKNEEAFIGNILQSMVEQTVLPERWIIVDDASTDRTADIIKTYATRYPWIHLTHRTHDPQRSFASKAYAVNAAFEDVRVLDFDIIGNLDADVSFEADYMEFLLRNFADDPELGVAGTPFTEDGDYDSSKDSFEGENYVAGPCQLFRRACFQEIGGYFPNPAGGVDWIAVMTARMKGWKVRSFADKRFHHHRSLGTAGRSGFSAHFSYGEKDYYLGNSPIWQMFRLLYRMAKPPFFVEGFALLLGYCWASVRRVPRPVSRELMHFHRQDQMHKLKTIFRRLVALKKVNNFSLTTKKS
jgi:glycosyltransferase involved in cell wall biosynthesis